MNDAASVGDARDRVLRRQGFHRAFLRAGQESCIRPSQPEESARSDHGLQAIHQNSVVCSRCGQGGAKFPDVAVAARVASQIVPVPPEVEVQLIRVGGARSELSTPQGRLAVLPVQQVDPGFRIVTDR